MERYDSNHVKNICLLGHSGSGKTTLAECMLFESGLINRRGSIDQGTTISDYHELEKERKNTVFSSLLNIPWRGYKINVIDTPGSDDFCGEVLSALQVADTGVLMLNATAGVEVTSDTIWAYTEEFKTPTICVINHLDKEDADFEVSSELKQTLLHCIGELHLKTIEWKLNHIHGVNVRFEQPRIPYRETITGTADAMYRHKKQSGGSGQFGEVTLRVEAWKEGLPEPTDVNVRSTERVDLPWGGKLEFMNCIVGGAIDARFIPSVLKGIMSVMEEGPFTGSYVRDVRVLLYDGKMHPVDSNDISFKIAGAQAFKAAFQLASPQLLEPVHQVVVLCSDDQVGSVMGDLQTRKGIVEGMEAEGSFQKITAKVPLVQLHNYSSALRGLMHGRARFSSSFAQYAPVDYETQEGLVKQHQHLAAVEVAM